jgi:A/G-specific adenine glycosylase
LGAALIDEVIKAWEGLGYYSRARNIHAAARIIIRVHGGDLPSSKEALLALPGLGPYTVGAILSFGFKQRSVAIDGNVARVISRYAWVDEEISKTSAKQKIEAAAWNLLSAETPWVSMEALIELGATICTSTPACDQCPLKTGCSAFARGMPTVLPIKSAALGHVLVRKNDGDQLMGDLWEFPYFEGIISSLGLMKKLTSLLGEKPIFIERMETLEHSFTRFAATLFPYKFKIQELKPIAQFSWIPTYKLHQLPFSAGHRKLVKLLYRGKNESFNLPHKNDMRPH